MPENVTHLPVDTITPSRQNPRRAGKSRRDLKELIQSIRAVGVLQPILVRRQGERFEVIAGERRWRASRAAGLERIPAIVHEDVDEKQALEMTVTENLQRADLHPLEEAVGIRALLGKGWEVKAIADRLGKPPSWVARRGRLTNLSERWRERVADPEDALAEWSGAHLELVARLDPAVQDEILDSYICEELPGMPELETFLSKLTLKLGMAPWNLDDDALVPEAGACAACPKTSQHMPGLFDDEVGRDRKAGGRCLDQHCWMRKLEAHVERRRAALVAKHGDVVLVNGKDALGRREAGLADCYQFERVEKGTPNAQLLLVARGAEAGKTYWARARGAQRAGDAPAPEKKIGPLSQEEKEKRLELRRKAHAVNALKEAFAKIEQPPAADIVLALAAAYGTTHRCDSPGPAFGHPATSHLDDINLKQTDAWQVFLSCKDDAARTQLVLWRATLPVLLRRLTWDRMDGVEDAAKEAFALAEQLGIDLESVRAEAEKAIPRPKAWHARGTDDASAKPQVGPRGRRGGPATRCRAAPRRSWAQGAEFQELMALAGTGAEPAMYTRDQNAVSSPQPPRWQC